MYLYPNISLNFLNGFLLIIPLILIRYVIPPMFNNKALSKLQYFPKVVGFENVALKVYHLSTNFIIFSSIFSKIHLNKSFSLIGSCIYFLGLFIFTFSIINFSNSKSEFTYIGLYRISRNPICIGYFLIFLGVSILIGSIFHILITLVYQFSVHWLILSEERWCINTFGKDYEYYMKKVPRYFLFI